MTIFERAERLAGLQAYGSERAASTGVTHEEAVQAVRRVLKRR